MSLARDASEWSTPRASDALRGQLREENGSARGPLELPTAQPAHTAERRQRRRFDPARPCRQLANQVDQWPTATAGDAKASGGRNECASANDGTTLSDLVRGKGRLNWRFVAWLMGWRWLIGETPRPWPPGPKDAAGWAEVLAVRPDLAPALAGSEPDRAAMLRLLGNGVVPEQAEAAVSGLLKRLR